MVNFFFNVICYNLALRFSEVALYFKILFSLFFIYSSFFFLQKNLFIFKKKKKKKKKKKDFIFKKQNKGLVFHLNHPTNVSPEFMKTKSCNCRVQNKYPLHTAQTCKLILAFTVCIFPKIQFSYDADHLLSTITYNIIMVKVIENFLTQVMLNPGMPCLCKQCRSRSVGFFRSQLIWICTVCH